MAAKEAAKEEANKSADKAAEETDRPLKTFQDLSSLEDSRKDKNSRIPLNVQYFSRRYTYLSEISWLFKTI